PAQARDLHMGDYTNLSIVLDLDLRKGIPAIGNPEGGEGTPFIPLPVNDVLDALGLDPIELPGGLLGGGGGGGGQNQDDGGKGDGKKDGDGGNVVGDVLDGIGLGRAAVGAGDAGGATVEGEAPRVDTDLAAMLVWGAVQR